MKELSNTQELKERIRLLEARRLELEQEVKKDLAEAASSFKPMKLIRAIIGGGSEGEGGQKSRVLSTALGTGAAYLIQKLLFKSPQGAAAGLAANLIQSGITALASRPELREKAAGWFRKLIRRKKKDDQSEV